MAVLSLDDVMKLPLDPDRLAKMGLLAPEPVTPPIVAPAKVTANLSPVASHEATGGAVKPMTPVTAAPPTGKSAADVPEIKLTPPGFEPTPDVLAKTVAPTPGPLPELTGAGKAALPVTSPGVPFGSSEYYRARLAQMAEQANAPHHGIGKLGHILGRIGNIALTVAAPGAATLIPGTDLNKMATAGHLENEMVRQQQIENEQTAEKAREAHEENVANTAEERLEETKKTNEAKDSATLAKQGLKRDDEGNIVADESSPIYKAAQEKQKAAEETRTNLNAYRQSQTDLNKARAEVEKAKNDPNSPAYKAAEKKLAMAEEAHRVAARNLELHEEQFENKLKEQELVKPSGQAQSRGSAAQAVLDVIPDLKGLVEKNRDNIGPIMGRLARGEVAIGNVPPDIARLYSAMKSFYALQPAVHGFRNAEFVKDFETALGTLERDPDSFIAGMEGLKPTLESVAKEGKTYHKRIVEGEGGGEKKEGKKPLPF